jgi:signal transduction histidine kinase
MERLRTMARGYGLEVLAVVLAIEGVAAAALRHPAPGEPHLIWFDVPAIALVIAPLLGRRRFPFCAPAAVWLLAAAVSVIDGGFTADSVSGFLAGMIAAFLLGNLSDGRRARIGLAVVLCGAAMVIHDKPGHGDAELILIPVLFAIAWSGGLALRERAGHAEAAELRAAHAESEQEAAARVAVAEERSRIARELHDTIAHAVSVMVLQAGAVRHKLPETDAELKGALRGVEQAGRTALADMRHLLDAMRADGEGAELAPQPGLDRLSGLLEEIRRAGLPVQLRVAGDRVPLPGGIDISAYRIVQEGLTNVLKHANATEAVVSLAYETDRLSIEVGDNGQGAGARGCAGASSAAEGAGGGPTGTGHGLIGIRERVRLFDGEMTMGSQPGGGFLLRTRLPLTRQLT